MLHVRFVVETRLCSTLLGDIWLCHDLQNHNNPVVVKQLHLDLARQAIDSNLHLDNPWNESYALIREARFYGITGSPLSPKYFSRMHPAFRIPAIPQRPDGCGGRYA
ncbi:unnamed protein product [Phytophthora lilii]|uniref:Unnamed protein product n=1 Tax=Phytophthora lilii TaxID=2077276 RepID=A0A9W6TZF6_9STRA|nr:unnamed protein product [Phytophthora lilii]